MRDRNESCLVFVNIFIFHFFLLNLKIWKEKHTQKSSLCLLNFTFTAVMEKTRKGTPLAENAKKQKTSSNSNKSDDTLVLYAEDTVPPQNKLVRDVKQDFSPYAVGGTLRVAEQQNSFFLRTFRLPGKQYLLRRSLVMRAKKMCTYFSLFDDTFHLAVRYLDIFIFHNTEEKESKLMLVLAASIFIAAKVNETGHKHKDSATFSPEELGEAFREGFGGDLLTRRSLIKCEEVLLRTLDYRCTPPTVVTFAQAYTGLILSSRCEQRLKVNEYVFLLCNRSLSRAESLQFDESCLSFGIVCHVLIKRFGYVFSELQKLCSFTGYGENEFNKISKWLEKSTLTGVRIHRETLSLVMTLNGTRVYKN
jgi:hypothetical protein